MKKKIIIAEYISTGINYIYDILSLGYEPVLLDCNYVATEEDLRYFHQLRKSIRARLPKGITVIEENPDYNAVLEQVRALDPVLIIAGSEFGVPYATRLAEDLGLPGNPTKNLRAMTEKDAMHQALKEYGIRYIRGQVITSVEEAREYYQTLDTEHVVVKRVRGAGTQGVYMCHGLDEVLQAVEKELQLSIKNGETQVALLMQERIIGTEYIVNTVSCNGRHRVTSLWVYDKVTMSNGTNAYNTAETVNHLDVGHSRLIRYAYDVLDAIGIQYGPVHGEFMVDEKGPVLIEVNCRPMGGGLTRKYAEQLFGHHETDCALEAYLNPEKFEIERNKPYRPKRKGAIKFIILPQDTIAESTPALPLCTRLQSYYSCVFDRIGRELVLTRTKDLETAGGNIYLIHDDEKVVRNECDLLHQIEMKYPALIFQDMDSYAPAKLPTRDIPTLVEKLKNLGSILIFSDQDMTLDNAAVVHEDDLKHAYDSYEQGILDLSDSKTFCDLEVIFRQIYAFADHIREGGRLIIPESTYCNIPYGIEGMEILLKIAGLQIECPLADMGNLLIASITK